jgi:hypothetical protein
MSSASARQSKAMRAKTPAAAEALAFVDMSLLLSLSRKQRRKKKEGRQKKEGSIAAGLTHRGKSVRIV